MSKIKELKCKIADIVIKEILSAMTADPPGRLKLERSGYNA